MSYEASQDLIITRPRPKAGGRVLNPPWFVLLFFYFFSFGVTNRHSRDADWSQVGHLETLIGSHAVIVFRSRALALAKSLFSGTRLALASILGPF